MHCLAEVDWSQIFSPSNTPLIAIFGMSTIVSVAFFFFGGKYMTQKNNNETNLKRDLIAKGYSADEIEQIIKAGPDKK